MITLTCTKCKVNLEMDDAFAGGVCRCQYCGTIQTVPSHMKRTARPATPTSNTQKALYSSGAGAAASSAASHSAPPPTSGLDDLATAVASSGISSNLTNSQPGTSVPHSSRVQSYATPRQQTQSKQNKTPLIIGGAVGGAVLAALGVWFLVGRGDSPKPATGTPTGNPTAQQTTPPPQPPKPIEANFLGVPLSSSRKVAFILDCSGSSHRDIFDSVRATLDRALQTLRPDQQFQVLLWTEAGTGSKQASDRWYPEKGVVFATKDQLTACQAKYADFIVAGKTEVGPAISRALESKPDTIIIATAQGVNMDGSVLAAIRKAMNGKSGVTIHTIDLTRSADGKSELEPAARITPGGTFRHVPPEKLN